MSSELLPVNDSQRHLPSGTNASRLQMQGSSLTSTSARIESVQEQNQTFSRNTNDQQSRANLAEIRSEANLSKIRSPQQTQALLELHQKLGEVSSKLANISKELKSQRLAESSIGTFSSPKESLKSSPDPLSRSTSSSDVDKASNTYSSANSPSFRNDTSTLSSTNVSPSFSSPQKGNNVLSHSQLKALAERASENARQAKLNYEKIENDAWQANDTVNIAFGDMKRAHTELGIQKHKRSDYSYDNIDEFEHAVRGLKNFLKEKVELLRLILEQLRQAEALFERKSAEAKIANQKYQEVAPPIAKPEASNQFNSYIVEKKIGSVISNPLGIEYPQAPIEKITYIPPPPAVPGTANPAK